MRFEKTAVVGRDVGCLYPLVAEWLRVRKGRCRRDCLATVAATRWRCFEIFLPIFALKSYILDYIRTIYFDNCESEVLVHVL